MKEKDPEIFFKTIFEFYVYGSHAPKQIRVISEKITTLCECEPLASFSIWNVFATFERFYFDQNKIQTFGLGFDFENKATEHLVQTFAIPGETSPGDKDLYYY